MWNRVILMIGLPKCRQNWGKIRKMLKIFPCLKLYSRYWNILNNCKCICRWIKDRDIIWCWRSSIRLKLNWKMLRMNESTLVIIFFKIIIKIWNNKIKKYYFTSSSASFEHARVIITIMLETWCAGCVDIWYEICVYVDLVP